MKRNIYCVYDSQVKSYMTPMFMENDGAAVRALQNAVNSQDNDIGMYPQHFTLFHLGTFDNQTAEFDLNTTPRSVMQAHHLMDENRVTPTTIDKIFKEILELKKEINQ